MEAPPFNVARPVKVETPVLIRDENVANPAVRESTPISIEPKAAVIEPEDSVPTEVRDEAVIPAPSVVEVRTSLPAIWYLV